MFFNSKYLWSGIYFILLSATVAGTITSCGNGADISNPQQDWRPFNGPPVSAKAMTNPGALHNEVLDAFHARHSLVTCDEMGAADFVQVMAESVNEVLAGNNEATRVTEEDVTLMLRVITTLSRKGIYDFYGETVSDPQKLIDFLSEHGKVTESQTKNLKRVVTLLPVVTEPMNSIAESDIFQNAADMDSWYVFMSVDILQHSKKYWLDMNEQRDSLGHFDDKHGSPRMVTIREAGGYVSDVLGGLVGFVAFGGVGAIVTAPLSSLVFQMGLDGLNGAIDTLDNGDYIYPADWWDDAC